MRFLLILSLALLSQTTAFQTAHPTTAIRSRAATVETCLRSELTNEAKDKLITFKPKRRRVLSISRLSTFQLSALTTTQLMKDERKKFNKDRLIKMGITMTTAFLTAFKKTSVARAAAATPLYITKGAITPLIAQLPGLGIVEMPIMRSISPVQVGRLPNPGAMFFALALFVTTALLRSAGDGYAGFVHFMTKHLTNMIQKEDEEIEMGLPTETNWLAYSHSKLDPLQKKTRNEFCKYAFNPHTFLFERMETKTEGGLQFILYFQSIACLLFSNQLYC